VPRAFYKAYYGDGGDCANILDMLRASFVFDTFDELYKAFSIIEEIINQTKTIKDGILRVKDTFAEEKVKSGHRQVIINFYCPTTEIVCELQLHYQLFDKYGKETHWLYDRTRLFEVNGRNLAFDYIETDVHPKLGTNIEYKGGIPLGYNEIPDIIPTPKVKINPKDIKINTQIINIKPLKYLELRALKAGDMVDYQSNTNNGTWMKSVVVDKVLSGLNDGFVWLHEIGSIVQSKNGNNITYCPSTHAIRWNDDKENKKIAPLGMFDEQIKKHLMTKLHVNKLQKYDQISVLDTILNNWEPCTLIEELTIDPNSNTLSINIHYNNWNNDFDTWISVDQLLQENRLALPFIVRVENIDNDYKEPNDIVPNQTCASFDEDFSKSNYLMLNDGKTAQFLKCSSNKKYQDYHLFPMCRVSKPVTDSSMEIKFKIYALAGWYGISNKNVEADGFGGYCNHSWLINKAGQMMNNKVVIEAQSCNSNDEYVKLKYDAQEKCIYVTVNHNEYKYKHNDMPNFNDAYFTFSICAGRVELVDV